MLNDQHEPVKWHWFKGNQVTAGLLQDVCFFRSCVLFNSGFRKNFGQYGKNFGDIQYSDFESLHIVASIENKIIGTVRITPPLSETVGLSIIGPSKFKNLVSSIGSDLENVVEINRLMIDDRFRSLKVGQSLMAAAIAVIEINWNINKIEILGTAGNCTKQADFFLKYTDYQRIDSIGNISAPEFNDEVTFLRYKKKPYVKGVEKIIYFTELFKNMNSVRTDRYSVFYKMNDLHVEEPQTEL